MTEAKFRPVLRVASGNFLEAYDFHVFGYYATYISRAFFRSGNDFASLMLTFMTFGAGFLMRPLGAVILGAYVDHHGRRAGLLLTLGLMAVGTLSIACTPSFAAIGILAPLLGSRGTFAPGLVGGCGRIDWMISGWRLNQSLVENVFRPTCGFSPEFYHL